MGKVKGMTAALLLGCVTFALPVSASGTNVQIDAEPIQGGKISAAQLQKGDTLQYSFSVKNTHIKSMALGSEVARVTWGSEGDQKIVQDIERSSEDNIFHGELKIEEGMQPGKWKIDHILFPDSYSYAKVTSLMQEWDGIKVLGQGGTLTSVVDDLSFSEFTVQGTKADGKAPVVRKKSIALTGKAVKKKGKAKLYVKASDKYGNKTTLKNKKLPKLILIRK